jgi:hypothetical protein
MLNKNSQYLEGEMKVPAATPNSTSSRRSQLDMHNRILNAKDFGHDN